MPDSASFEPRKPLPEGAVRTTRRLLARGQANVATIAICAVGAVTIAGGYWYQKERSDRLRMEEQIVYAGNEITDAIASYYGATPGKVRELPREWTDLLDDNRNGQHAQHLRDLPLDPMTGRRDWVPVRDRDGRITGVHSASSKQSLGLPAFASARVTGERYSDWLFAFDPPARLRVDDTLAARPPDSLRLKEAQNVAGAPARQPDDVPRPRQPVNAPARSAAGAAKPAQSAPSETAAYPRSNPESADSKTFSSRRPVLAAGTPAIPARVPPGKAAGASEREPSLQPPPVAGTSSAAAARSTPSDAATAARADAVAAVRDPANGAQAPQVANDYADSAATLADMKLRLAKQVQPEDKYPGQRLETMLGKTDPRAKPLDALPPLVSRGALTVAANENPLDAVARNADLDPLHFTVKFVFEGVALGPSGRALVANLANDAAGSDHLELLGQADGTGPEWINQRIATARAESVRYALVRAGVSPDTIRVRPVVIHRDALSPAEQADARRVDIDLFIKNGKPGPRS